MRQLAVPEGYVWRLLCEGGEHVCEAAQALVDGLGLLAAVTLGPGARKALRAGQVDEMELAVAHLFRHARALALLHVHGEDGVGAFVLSCRLNVMFLLKEIYQKFVLL